MINSSCIEILPMSFFKVSDAPRDLLILSHWIALAISRDLRDFGVALVLGRFGLNSTRKQVVLKLESSSSIPLQKGENFRSSANKDHVATFSVLSRYFRCQLLSSNHCIQDGRLTFLLSNNLPVYVRQSPAPFHC